ncbi:MAG TPA: nucleoside triphosphate pyrophosphohydrolase family protein [Candidatus Nanoarchaeia archaeon]|nr:nucleoside triphosphate pyrophosphohydrolase family protein [Candidatus Nanoarchaeia archaeon]
MDFNEYQKRAWKTAIYPHKGKNLSYPALGLGGEAGEVMEKIKKMFRDDAGKLTPERRDAIIKELGDVLWYLAAISSEIKVDLDEVAQTNIEKLYSRKDRNLLHGSGDNR